VNENIQAFLKVLDPQDNTTGGGTASAVAGAMAASLAAMVARLSIGKEGMQPDRFYSDAIDECEALRTGLFDGGRIDSQAFEAVSAAFRLPKTTDEEKSERRAAIQAGWVQAAEVPLANAESCAEVMRLALYLRGRSNPNTASDLECAFHLGLAGLKGCIANVEINLPAIKDEAVVAELSHRIQTLKETAREYIWE